uniref:Beta-carotene isomerase D27-like C-terminal domain-containing protein n=1 Tax=Oryza meridionalis TaxID=40149 RepID=A0A0E0DLK8_9ORYZ
MAAPSPPCLLRVLLPVASSSSRGLRRRRRPTTSLLRCSSPSADTASSSGEGGREYEPSFADDFLHAFFRAKIVEVFVEKCKYLEESKCLGVCINTCKLPTQTFFKDHMGVDLYMEPNFEDYSCQFNFGVSPPPLDTDKALKEPCLDICTNARRRKELGTGSSTDSLQCPQV